MAYKQVLAFKTSDDKLFLSEKEASAHERILGLEAWYYMLPIRIKSGSTMIFVNWGDVKPWLERRGLLDKVIQTFE